MELDEPLPELTANCCIICLNNDARILKFKDIESLEIDGASALEKLHNLCGVKHKTDGLIEGNLPMKICSLCELYLLSALQLCKKAKQSEKIIECVRRKRSPNIRTLEEEKEEASVVQQEKIKFGSQHKHKEWIVALAPNMFACRVCKKTFTRKENLLRHANVHKGDKAYTCKHCGKSFLRSDYLIVHEATHMRRKKSMDTEEINKDFDEDEYDIVNVPIVEEKEIKKEKQFVQLDVPPQNQNIRDFACDICKKKFGRKDIMLNHMLTHNEDRQFQYTLCKKSFKQRATLIGHRGIHFDDVYTCKICEMEFGKRNEARTHVSLYHPESNMRDVIEQVPKKKSSSRKSKPRVSNRKNSCRYICDKCGKKFLSKQGVIYHLKEHFGVLEYACSFCPRSFGSVEKLKEHIMLHSKDHPLERLVSKSSATKDDFQVRVLIHTVDRPHKCPTCDKGFKRHVQLISHVETHKLTS